jgi:hypothetical protein
MLALTQQMQLPPRLREGFLSSVPLLVAQTIAVPLLLRWTERRRLRERGGPFALKALAIGATAVGAFALGALSIGAVSIGALGLGSLGIGSARMKRVRIQSLTVDELNLPPLPMVS